MLLRPIQPRFRGRVQLGGGRSTPELVEAAPPHGRTYKAGTHPHHLDPETHIQITHTTSSDYTAMSGPPTGQYLIRLIVGGDLYAGVDPAGYAPVPVILDGIDRVVSPLVFVQRQLRS